VVHLFRLTPTVLAYGIDVHELAPDSEQRFQGE
jgi:hypothetical protein